MTVVSAGENRFGRRRAITITVAAEKMMNHSWMLDIHYFTISIF
jgi:hypothetical protein